MKATDLMIGDWMYNSYHKKNIKWDYSEMFCLNGIPVIGLDLEPIPLTPEIFEKNGWERDIDKEWKYNNSHILPRYCYQWEKRNMKIEMYAGLEGFTISLIIGRRFYAVHELQHILRLCGFDELADNLKV